MSMVPAIPTPNLTPRVRGISTSRRFDFSTVPPQNHPKPEPPQHVSATTLANVPQNFFRLLSPTELQDLRPCSEAACRLAMAHQRPQHRPVSPLLQQSLSPSSPQAAGPPNFDVSTFRLFDVSTKNHPKPEPPQPMPATRVAYKKNRVCHYMSPSDLHDLRAGNALVFILDPSASRMLLVFFLVEFLFADSANVRSVFVLPGRLVARRIVVAFVQAKMLRFGLGRTRPLYDHGFQRSVQQFGVVNVCAGHDDRQRAALPLYQQAAFYAVFRTIRRVRADIIPPKRALPIAASAACHSQSTSPNSSHMLTIADQMRSINPNLTQR